MSLFLVLLFLLYFKAKYTKNHQIVLDNTMNEFRRYESSYHAGGSGMVITKDGKIKNAIEPDECRNRAEKAFNTSDLKINFKTFAKTFFETLFIGIIIVWAIFLI